MRRTLIHYGTTLCKLPNRPGGLFYLLVLYGLFTCCTSYQTDQTDFHPLALLRLAARATEQAKGTFTLWHFYDLLDCETPNRSDGLPPSDTWRLYHSQSAWVGWWPRSRTTFDLHASLVWSAGIIATFVSRRLGGEVPWLWGRRGWHAWYDADAMRLIEGLIVVARKVGGWSWQVTYRP